MKAARRFWKIHGCSNTADFWDPVRCNGCVVVGVLKGRGLWL